MVSERFLPDFQLANGDGVERPFHELLADFNILAIRRVPAPSHGPATELLRSLLAENRGAENLTVRGFDVRSSEDPCEMCHSPHLVFQRRDLVTVCDGGGGIYRMFEVVGDDRFFVITPDRRVFDAGSIDEIDRFSMHLDPEVIMSPHRVARAPPER